MNGKLVNTPVDILQIIPPGAGEVIRIDSQGRLFWHQREVETDADFRKAMLECAKHLAGIA